MRKPLGRRQLKGFNFKLITLVVVSFLFAGAVQAQTGIEIPRSEVKDSSFIQVKDLNIGDVVFIKEGETLVPHIITKLQYQEDPAEVYNLSVDGEQTFFANDFAVHNKFGEHDAVCDVAVAPRLSSASSETWSYSGCSASDGGSCESDWTRNKYKGMFQMDGMGVDDTGFVAGQMVDVCLFGAAKPNCVFIYDTARMPREPCLWCGNVDNDRCWDGDVLNGFTAKCNCRATWTPPNGDRNCFSQCDSACTSYHPAGDPPAGGFRIRAYHVCPDPNAGAAVKLTPPSDYVIKSITFNVRATLPNGKMGGFSRASEFGVSRGMNYGLSNNMMPRAKQYTLTTNGTKTNQKVDFDGGTKYAFFYLEHTADCEWTADVWAQVYNIRVELVKKTDVEGEEVTIINNSLLYYDGVNTNNPENSSRWPTIVSGLISFSNDRINFSTPVNIASNWTANWTLPQGAEGYKAVYARVVPTGSVAGNPAICMMNIYYHAPNQPPDCNTLTGVGTEVIQGEILNLTATVSDVDGTAEEVKFYYSPNISANQCDGWQLIGTDTNGANGWTTTWDTGSVSKGDYYVFARVKDDDDAWCDNPILCGADGATAVCSTDCRATVTVKFIADAWYQTKGGDIYSQTGITSLIPAACEEDRDAGGDCDPNYSLFGDEGYPGIISYYSGSANFNEGYASNDSETHWLISPTQGVRERFDYFYQRAGAPDEDEFDSLDLSTTTSGEVYYSVDDATIGGDLPAGTKIVVLVGDSSNSRHIDISSNITVPIGSSLVVIASGNITIADDVDTVEGIYVADGAISTGSGDTKFFGNGSFIASSFNFGRDFAASDPGDERNNTEPVEELTYRPDLVLNVPSILWLESLTWQELAP